MKGKAMFSDEEIKDTVCQIISDVLSADRDEITPGARFFADLGGESIDLLDLTFRCEKTFGVKIQIDKMLSADDVQTDATGQLTPQSIAAIGAKLPSLDLGKVRPDMGPSAIQEMLTVGVITDYVKFRLMQASAA